MTESLLADFTAYGYAVARGLFDLEEVDRLRDHFMGLRRRGAYANDLAGVRATGAIHCAGIPGWRRCIAGTRRRYGGCSTFGCGAG